MINSRIVIDRYAGIHITLVSVLLGLALADLATIVRSIENPNLLDWLIVIEIVLLAINAWMAYSTYSLSIKVKPSLTDVFGAFGLGAIHFFLNTTLTKEIYYFFFVFAAYNIIGGTLTMYNISRSSQDKMTIIDKKPFYPVAITNLAAFIIFIIIGIISLKSTNSELFNLLAIGVVLILSIAWLLLYWKAWVTQLGQYNIDEEE